MLICIAINEFTFRCIALQEDILTLLLDFLQSPHVTRDVLLEEKEKVWTVIPSENCYIISTWLVISYLLVRCLQTGQKRKRKARTSIEKKSGEVILFGLFLSLFYSFYFYKVLLFVKKSCDILIFNLFKLEYDWYFIVNKSQNLLFNISSSKMSFL